MWLAGQNAVNDPSEPAVAWVVGAHCHPVCRPRRSTSTIEPASERGIVPENWNPLRSIADSGVEIVIPFPVEDTVTFPGWIDTAEPGRTDEDEMLPLDVGTALPPTPDPPELARAY
jgi:hypothetical protein